MRQLIGGNAKILSTVLTISFRPHILRLETSAPECSAQYPQEEKLILIYVLKGNNSK